MEKEGLTLRELQMACFGLGVPDQYRGLVWRILLNCASIDKNSREEKLNVQRQQYSIFLEETNASKLIPITGNQSDVRSSSLSGRWQLQSSPMPIKREENITLSSPLEFPGFSESSVESPVKVDVASKEEDILLLAEIDKDISRTHPGLHFFNSDKNLAAMRRILFVYAKLNNGVRYVQGMDQILAPIWYVLADDPSIPDRLDAEADTFFSLMSLMSEIRDVFITAHDNSPTGVRGIIAKFVGCLQRREPSVHLHLLTLKVDPMYYTLRWITTLMSRELLFPDVLMLWDSLFSDPYRFSFLIHFSVGVMRTYKKKLLETTFGTAMKFLQNIPQSDFLEILQVSLNIRDEEERDGGLALLSFGYGSGGASAQRISNSQTPTQTPQPLPNPRMFASSLSFSSFAQSFSSLRLSSANTPPPPLADISSKTPTASEEGSTSPGTILNQARQFSAQISQRFTKSWS
jgi:TBC1 domain family member 13